MAPLLQVCVGGAKGRRRQTGWLDGQLLPPSAAYCTLMSFRLVALDKRQGVRLVGIGETLRHALAKLVMRAAGEQANTACGNFQLCAGLKAGIEGATHAVGHKRLERSRQRQREDESRRTMEEKGTESVAAVFANFNKETAGTEEEAAEGLEAAL